MTLRPVISIGHPTLRVVADEVPVEPIAGKETLDRLLQRKRKNEDPAPPGSPGPV